jgi:HSP20 family protein
MKLLRTSYPVTYSNPFAELDRIFEETFGGFPARRPNGQVGATRPRADLLEAEHNYTLRVELPGVKKDEVSIEVEGREFRVEAKRETEDEKFHLRRTLSLPDDVSTEGIEAKLENGILSVTLPKAEDAKPRLIQIQ